MSEKDVNTAVEMSAEAKPPEKKDEKPGKKPKVRKQPVSPRLFFDNPHFDADLLDRMEEDRLEGHASCYTPRTRLQLDGPSFWDDAEEVDPLLLEPRKGDKFLPSIVREHKITGTSPVTPQQLVERRLNAEKRQRRGELEEPTFVVDYPEGARRFRPLTPELARQLGHPCGAAPELAQNGVGVRVGVRNLGAAAADAFSALAGEDPALEVASLPDEDPVYIDPDESAEESADSHEKTPEWGSEKKLSQRKDEAEALSFEEPDSPPVDRKVRAAWSTVRLVPVTVPPPPPLNAAVLPTAVAHPVDSYAMVLVTEPQSQGPQRPQPQWQYSRPMQNPNTISVGEGHFGAEVGAFGHSRLLPSVWKHRRFGHLAQLRSSCRNASADSEWRRHEQPAADSDAAAFAPQRSFGRPASWREGEIAARPTLPPAHFGSDRPRSHMRSFNHEVDPELTDRLAQWRHGTESPAAPLPPPPSVLPKIEEKEEPEEPKDPEGEWQLKTRKQPMLKQRTIDMGTADAGGFTAMNAQLEFDPFGELPGDEERRKKKAGGRRGGIEKLPPPEPPRYEPPRTVEPPRTEKFTCMQLDNPFDADDLPPAFSTSIKDKRKKPRVTFALPPADSPPRFGRSASLSNSLPPPVQQPPAGKYVPPQIRDRQPTGGDVGRERAGRSPPGESNDVRVSGVQSGPSGMGAARRFRMQHPFTSIRQLGDRVGDRRRSHSAPARFVSYQVADGYEEFVQTFGGPFRSEWPAKTIEPGTSSSTLSDKPVVKASARSPPPQRTLQDRGPDTYFSHIDLPLNVPLLKTAAHSMNQQPAITPHVKSYTKDFALAVRQFYRLFNAQPEKIWSKLPTAWERKTDTAFVDFLNDGLDALDFVERADNRSCCVERNEPADPPHVPCTVLAPYNLFHYNPGFGIYSRKVFVGGVPADLDEQEFLAIFRRFGKLTADWPTRLDLAPRPHAAPASANKCRFGYVFLIYADERSVHLLLGACSVVQGEYFMRMPVQDGLKRVVQVRPWRLAEADFLVDPFMRVNLRFAVFIGGVPRPIRAAELAHAINVLYGNVVMAGIDTDVPLKYPKGAGRVVFSDFHSYMRAISDRFVRVRHGDLDRIVEVKPYVLDDQRCDECHGELSDQRVAPFFCPSPECLQYYCEKCWAVLHACGRRAKHRPLVKEA
ncbi:Cytoplasmic polyadenylation element binding protein 3 [Aphelenchoides fujianensis]|nr:Cytoplasmic polyadenylation element binding protein 3 [Aphelenchoides fujianensis]